VLRLSQFDPLTKPLCMSVGIVMFDEGNELHAEMSPKCDVERLPTFGRIFRVENPKQRLALRSF
jgi:hypothetical protein